MKEAPINKRKVGYIKSDDFDGKLNELTNNQRELGGLQWEFPLIIIIEKNALIGEGRLQFNEVWENQVTPSV